MKSIAELKKDILDRLKQQEDKKIDNSVKEKKELNKIKTKKTNYKRLNKRSEELDKKELEQLNKIEQTAQENRSLYDRKLYLKNKIEKGYKLTSLNIRNDILSLIDEKAIENKTSRRQIILNIFEKYYKENI